VSVGHTGADCHEQLTAEAGLSLKPSRPAGEGMGKTRAQPPLARPRLRGITQ